MKILIASASAEVSQEISKTLERILPAAFFLSASSSEAALSQLDRHGVDLALVDIQLLAGCPAAAAILKLASPDGLFNALMKERLAPSSTAPRILLTFDGSQYRSVVRSLPSKLQRVARQAAQRRSKVDGIHLWAQRLAGGWESVHSSSLAWAVAEQGRVHVHDLQGRVYLLRDRLKELENRLDPVHFCRIHKSYLVNLAQVLSVQPWSSGGFLLEVADRDRTRLPISRRYAAHLKERTGWTVGPVSFEHGACSADQVLVG